MKSPRFLNVDLEIESTAPLDALARELGSRVSVLFSQRVKKRYCLFLEIAGNDRGQDATINNLCGLVEGLSPAGKRLWDAARRRDFDIGYEARLGSMRANHFTIRPRTLRRVAKLGASLAVTLYHQADAGAEGERKRNLQVFRKTRKR